MLHPDMSWVTEWVGAPYQVCGTGPRYDCWHLIVAIYRERLGIHLPSHTGYADTMTDETALLIERGKGEWRPVTDPEPYDVVLFLVDGKPNHIGLVIAPGLMLHTTRHKDACIESYRAAQWRDRLEGFYRWSS